MIIKLYFEDHSAQFVQWHGSQSTDAVKCWFGHNLEYNREGIRRICIDILDNAYALIERIYD